MEGSNWKVIMICAGSALLKDDIRRNTGIGQYLTSALTLLLAVFGTERI